jgi:hypothetical protein
MERNSHEITNQWKAYEKRLFSEDLEVQDDKVKRLGSLCKVNIPSRLDEK